jgi:hypothetical protein
MCGPCLYGCGLSRGFKGGFKGSKEKKGVLW